MPVTAAGAGARRLLATGCWTPAAGGRGTGVTTWELDPASGALVPLAALALPAPSWVAWHPRLPVLYAALEVEQGAVAALAVDPAGGLRELGRAASGGASPCHLAVTPDGRSLVAAAYGGGSVAVLALAGDGALGERTGLAVLSGRGPDPDRQEAPHPHQVVLDPDDRGRTGAEPLVLVPDLGTDQVRAWRLTADGALRAADALALPPGTGPRQVHVRGGARHVLGELSGEVLRVAPDGRVLARARTSAVGGPAGAGGAPHPSELVALGGDDALLVANRAPATLGVLDASPRLVAELPLDVAWPRHVALLGDLLVAAGQRDDSLVVHRVRGLGGPPAMLALEPLWRAATGSPTCVAARPVPSGGGAGGRR